MKYEERHRELRRQAEAELMNLGKGVISLHSAEAILFHFDEHAGPLVDEVVAALRLFLEQLDAGAKPSWDEVEVLDAVLAKLDEEATAMKRGDLNVTTLCGSCAGGDHQCDGDCDCPRVDCQRIREAEL